MVRRKRADLQACLGNTGKQVHGSPSPALCIPCKGEEKAQVRKSCEDNRDPDTLDPS